MPFRDAFAIFQTADLDRAVGFYVERFGFEERYRFPGFAVVGLDGFDLGFAETADLSAAGRAAIWLYAEDVDAEIERLARTGVEIARQPEDQAWGERMGSVLDLDGNEVFIGQRQTA